MTIPKMIDRVRDTDYRVRLAVYAKCAKMGPRILKLTDRQQVILAGFDETHAAVKEYFVGTMLSKWLTVYNGNLVSLLGALKLDANEEDIRQTEIVCQKVLNAFFKYVWSLLIIVLIFIELSGSIF